MKTVCQGNMYVQVPKASIHKRDTRTIKILFYSLKQMITVLVRITCWNFNLLNHKSWATIFFYYGTYCRIILR